MDSQPWARFQGLATCVLRSMPGQPNVTVHVEWAANQDGDTHELAFELRCTMGGLVSDEMELFNLEVPRMKMGAGPVMAAGNLNERMPPEVMASVVGIVSEELRNVSVALAGMGNLTLHTGDTN